MSRSNFFLRMRQGLPSTPALGRTRRGGAIDVLTVDIAAAPSSGRTIAALAEQARSGWLKEASAFTDSAVVLVTRDFVDFYTVDPDHLRGIRPRIRMVEHALALAGLGAECVVAQRGPTALRRLMNFSAGLWTDAAGAHRAAAEIQVAASLAREHHTLCPLLEALFRSAAQVGRRVAQESFLHDPRLCPSSRELEQPNVERIIEEELAIYGLIESSFTKQGPAASTARVCPPPFEQPEPRSQVRLRIAVPVEPQIIYLEPSRRAAKT